MAGFEGIGNALGISSPPSGCGPNAKAAVSPAPPLPSALESDADAWEGIGNPPAPHCAGVETLSGPTAIKAVSRPSFKDPRAWLLSHPQIITAASAPMPKRLVGNSQFYRILVQGTQQPFYALAGVPAGFDPNASYPVVIYNRGGNSDFGAMHTGHAEAMHDYFINQGYVVFAAEHRGTGHTPGADGFGSDEDIAMVLDLVGVGGTASAIDRTRIYMAGHSRGGMTTYRALAAGAEVSAAVVIAGVSDLHTWPVSRMAANGDNIERDVYEAHIPGYQEADDQERKRLLSIRSGVELAAEIPIPVLIAHGTADSAVDYQQGVSMAAALKTAGGSVEFLSLPGAGHSLTGHRGDAKRAFQAFFEKHQESTDDPTALPRP